MLQNGNPTQPRKAIAYIRVSSQRQVDEGVSIQAQKRRILEIVLGKNVSFQQFINKTLLFSLYWIFKSFIKTRCTWNRSYCRRCCSSSLRSCWNQRHSCKMCSINSFFLLSWAGLSPILSKSMVIQMDLQIDGSTLKGCFSAFSSRSTSSIACYSELDDSCRFLHSRI